MASDQVYSLSNQEKYMEYLGPIEDKSWMDSKIHRAELQVRRTSKKVRLETRLKRRIENYLCHV